LLYVAITRAEKHCILTCAQNRWRYGKMEYDTPSRFIRDIDPSLLQVESSGADSKTVSHSSGFGSVFGPSHDYNGNKYSRSSSYVQNARPVATQFKADPKPRIVPPLSGNFRRVSTSTSSTGTGLPSSGGGQGNGLLHEGSVIEHQRFGIGTVIKLEGTGENQKATVQFKNTGTKQLLLKFARFTVVG
jgi:DNA helicase-2/ATP-dependent DNA helicase PcrA